MIFYAIQEVESRELMCDEQQFQNEKAAPMLFMSEFLAQECITDMGAEGDCKPVKVELTICNK